MRLIYLSLLGASLRVFASGYDDEVSNLTKRPPHVVQREVEISPLDLKSIPKENLLFSQKNLLYPDTIKKRCSLADRRGLDLPPLDWDLILKKKT